MTPRKRIPLQQDAALNADLVSLFLRIISQMLLGEAPPKYMVSIVCQL